MKYKGILSSDARGSVNGVTASRNRFGTYLRGRAVPVNPATTKQTVIRTRFAALSEAWKALSSTNQLAWASLAAQVPYVNSLGDTVYLTGHQLYIAWNLTMQTMNLATYSVPPGSPPAISSNLTVSAAAVAASALFTVTTGGSLNTPDQIMIEATPQISPGRTFIRPSEWRFLAKQTAAGAIAVNASWAAMMGTLVVGSKIGVRVTPISATYGRKGTPVQSTLIVA